PPQVGQRKVQPPFPRLFPLAASGITAIDDGQNRGNIGGWAITMVSIYSRESRHLIFPASTLPDKSGQCLHDRPVVQLALPRDALQRIDAAQANLEVVASEVLDRFGEALGDAPLLVSFGLLFVAQPGYFGLPRCCFSIPVCYLGLLQSGPSHDTCRNKGGQRDQMLAVCAIPVP